jgi:hypothetical protein
LFLSIIKINQWQPLKEMGRYQHRSILIAKMQNPINGCIMQSILGVHASRGDFGVSLGDVGQFWAITAIWDDFHVGFGQMSVLFREGDNP